MSYRIKFGSFNLKNIRTRVNKTFPASFLTLGDSNFDPCGIVQSLVKKYPEIVSPICAPNDKVTVTGTIIDPETDYPYNRWQKVTIDESMNNMFIDVLDPDNGRYFIYSSSRVWNCAAHYVAIVSEEDNRYLASQFSTSHTYMDIIDGMTGDLRKMFDLPKRHIVDCLPAADKLTDAETRRIAMITGLTYIHNTDDRNVYIVGTQNSSLIDVLETLREAAGGYVDPRETLVMLTASKEDREGAISKALAYFPLIRILNLGLGEEKFTMSLQYADGKHLTAEELGLHCDDVDDFDRTPYVKGIYQMFHI